MDPSGCGVQDHDLRRSLLYFDLRRARIFGGPEVRTRSLGEDLRMAGLAFVMGGLFLLRKLALEMTLNIFTTEAIFPFGQ
jgi:hypothetical protein